MTGPVDVVCFGTPGPLPGRQFDRPEYATSGTFIGGRTAGTGPGNATVRVGVGTGAYTAIIRMPEANTGLSTAVPGGTQTVDGPTVGPAVSTVYFAGPFVGPVVAPAPVVTGVVVSVITVFVIVAGDDGTVLGGTGGLPTRTLNRIPSPSLYSK